MRDHLENASNLMRDGLRNAGKVPWKEGTLAEGKDEFDNGDAEGEGQAEEGGENDDEGEEETRE